MGSQENPVQPMHNRKLKLYQTRRGVRLQRRHRQILIALNNLALDPVLQLHDHLTANCISCQHIVLGARKFGPQTLADCRNHVVDHLTLFAGSGKRRLEDGWELRVVPAFAVLQARREALERSAQDDGALGLWMNACVLARALYKDGQRAFSDGEAVMQAASAEKIEIDANERAVNEKSQCCFFVCTTFDSFLNDFNVSIIP